MPSSTRDLSIVIDGNGAFFGGTTSDQIREFSELGDTVILSTVTPSNLHTRMYGGNDIVTLSNVATGGFSNKVNGNLGDDRFTSQLGSTTRDFILGGNNNDRIDLSNSITGLDWQNGNLGDDTIIGATNAGAGFSILRGGQGNDNITINAGDTHIVTGDLGTDVITLNGPGRVVLRTDGENASPNRSEADRIVGFTGASKIYIPGINSTADLITTEVAGNTFLEASTFTNGTVGLRTIARIDGVTKAVFDPLIPTNVTVGNTADNALAALTPSNFLNNPTLSNIFA